LRERFLGVSPNEPRQVTAARLRIGLNVQGYVWAAARDGKRYCDTKSQVVLLNITRMG
jgi:hypothetical protein